MRRGARGFIPVLHAATLRRPDEIDTIVTAEAVATALEDVGHAAEIVALTPDLAPLEKLAARDPLVVFNLVDAVDDDCRLAPKVPARLDALGLPYTGARTSAWLETLSKIDTKRRLVLAGLPTPAWSADGTGLDPDARVIVKAVWEHGSLGMDGGSVVSGADAPRAVADHARRWHTDFFAEAYVVGREFAAAVMEGPRGVEVLPLRETVFEGFGTGCPRITDYDAKWTPGSVAFVGTPRRFGIERDEPALAAKLKQLALRCWDLFGVRGYARVDFRLDDAGTPFILEVNMNPCLGRDAGFAASAAEAGISYEDLIGRILEQACGVRAPARMNGHAAAGGAAPRLNGNGAGQNGQGAELQWRTSVAAGDVGRVRTLVESTGMFTAAEIDLAAGLVAERLAKGAASGCHFIFAERAGRLAGYACYGPVAGTQDSFDLHWIAVAPEAQGRGLGAELYARAETAMRAAHARHIYADTSASDRYAPTRRFYRQMGFAEQAHLPDYYAPGDGKIIYAKTLAAETSVSPTPEPAALDCGLRRNDEHGSMRLDDRQA